jgi:hypothetical protein
MEDMDDFLGGGAFGPSFKFTEVGDTCIGTVVSYKKVQDTDPSGNPKLWPNGQVKDAFVFNLETSTGSTVLWVKGQMIKAIKDAAREAKVSSMTGCKIEVEFYGLGEQKQRGYQAPKLYRAKVTPPVASAMSADDLLG